jgi:hypothetical protein
MIHFDQKIWKQTFISNKFNTQWKCGFCGIGGLQLSEVIQTKKSTWSGILRCTDPHCRKQYQVAGIVKAIGLGIEVSVEHFKIEDYKLYPTHFLPEVILFELPITLKEEVKINLVKSFNHFWYDLDACANKIRQAIELLVAEKGGVGSTLDQMIKSVRETLGDKLTETLLALKCIGNDGSHAYRPFEREEILDAYNLLVDVLNQMYPDESETQRRQGLVQFILENKGLKKA